MVAHRLSCFHPFHATANMATYSIRASVLRAWAWARARSCTLRGLQITVCIRRYWWLASSSGLFTHVLQAILVFSIFLIAMLATRASGFGISVRCGFNRGWWRRVQWWPNHLRHLRLPLGLSSDRFDHELLGKNSEGRFTAWATSIHLR